MVLRSELGPEGIFALGLGLGGVELRGFRPKLRLTVRVRVMVRVNVRVRLRVRVMVR